MSDRVVDPPFLLHHLQLATWANYSKSCGFSCYSNIFVACYFIYLFIIYLYILRGFRKLVMFLENVKNTHKLIR